MPGDLIIALLPAPGRSNVELNHIFGLYFSKQDFALSYSAALLKDWSDALYLSAVTLRRTDIFLRASLPLSLQCEAGKT